MSAEKSGNQPNDILVAEPGSSNLSPDSTLSIRWLGAGLPVFIGDAGKTLQGVPVRLGSYQKTLEIFRGAKKSKVKLFQCLEEFFNRGGKACYVINFNDLDNLTDEKVSKVLTGEDGPLGCRTGLQALNDLEDVGTIVAPGIWNETIQTILLEYTVPRPSKSLILEGPPGTTDPEELVKALGMFIKDSPDSQKDDPRDRVAWLSPDGRWTSSGIALGAHDTVDFHPDNPERILHSFREHEEVRTLGQRFRTLRTWRLWEGFRRSLDMGTRWVLFEIDDNFLRARMEREIRAFCYRLFEAGLFEGRRPEDAFYVSCQELEHDSSLVRSGRISMTVRARLRQQGVVAWNGAMKS